jgi:cyclophilin family peptidyl-prolyl cis-trans isomerase
MTSIAAVAPSLVPQAALSLANHQVPAVRAAVAKALVGRPEPEALQIERAYLTDASSLVVVAAIPAVAAATENLGEGLETVAASEDPVVRAAVAEAAGGRLAKPGTGEAVRADALALLDKIWQRSGRDSLPDARIGVIDAAAMAGRDPLSHAILLKGLEDTDRVVRLRAIARLKSVFDEDASAKAGAASDRPLDEYLAILEWARKPRAAIVMVQRPGYDPGRFTLQLDASVAPLASWNFAKLAEKGYYDGLIVHRVVPNFVVQDGDPRGDGYGGPGYSIRDEIGHLRFAAGVLGMASDGKDTAGSQWFITLSAQPHLDGRYTAFGEVVQNLTGVVGQIQPGDRIVGIRMYEGNGTEPLPPL